MSSSDSELSDSDIEVSCLTINASKEGKENIILIFLTFTVTRSICCWYVKTGLKYTAGTETMCE